MKKFKLMSFQEQALEAAKDHHACAFYHEMGLGKTFTGAEQLMRYDRMINLVICQISKVNDWVNHFNTYYKIQVFDLTKKSQLEKFLACKKRKLGVINYDKIARRKAITDLPTVSCILDESSMIKNSETARTKAIMHMNIERLVLLSGTPMGGKYEDLWTQCKLLGWRISKNVFFDRFVVTKDFFPKGSIFPIRSVIGYKNIDELKTILRNFGAQFLLASDVMELPDQVFQTIYAKAPPQYNEFIAKYYVCIGDKEYIGETPVVRMLYARMIASIYSAAKLQIVKDLLESAHDRVVIFYNFRDEFSALYKLVTEANRPIAYINGDARCLTPFEQPNAVMLCQSISGSKGINLQAANKLIVFSPTTSGEDYMQMLKRIHRIGQNRPCFYYLIAAKDTIEENIYQTLKRKQDYTLDLFKQDFS